MAALSVMCRVAVAGAGKEDQDKDMHTKAKMVKSLSKLMLRTDQVMNLLQMRKSVKSKG